MLDMGEGKVPNPKSLKDFVDCVNNLRTGVRLASDGDVSAYKIIAVQLRVLLCDKSNGKEHPLLLKVFQSVKLHPLRNTMLSNDDETKKWREGFGPDFNWNNMFIIPTMMEFNGQKTNIIEFFDENLSPIELKEWLEQPLFSNEISIKELIRSVADKESAHSDDNYGKTLSTTNQVKIGMDSLHEMFIVAIGKYILEKTSNAIKNINLQNQQ